MVTDSDLKFRNKSTHSHRDCHKNHRSKRALKLLLKDKEKCSLFPGFFHINREI